MRIESSFQQLESSSTQFASLTESRHPLRSSPATPETPQRGLLELSREAMAALQREMKTHLQGANETGATSGAAANDVAVSAGIDSVFSLFKSIIERLVGHEIRTFSPQDLPPRRELPAVQAPRAAQTGVETYRRYEEYERFDFSAEGVVKTADGQEIRFSLALSMERYYLEERWQRPSAPPRKDPLVLNFGGTAAELTNRTFAFDLDNDGTAENLPGLGAGLAWLVFDRNGDGQVDGGNELFGPRTDNGFAELTALDADGNGWIDEADPLFSRLGIWRPDMNGGAIQGLLAANVGALNLARVSTPMTLGSGRDGLGTLRESGVFLREGGGAGLIQEIDVNV